MDNLKILAVLFLFTAIARADFADDSYTDHPDVLFRIVAAAQHYKGLESSSDGQMALYLRRAEYIGPLIAPFGTVHVARLCFIRSAPKGSKHPARGRNYLVFLDHNLKIRTTWPVDMPDENLYVAGTKLMCGNDLVMDYGHLPVYPAGSILPQGTILYDNKSEPIPEWN